MGLAAEAANAAMWVWDVSADDLWMTEQGRSLLLFLDYRAVAYDGTMSGCSVILKSDVLRF